MRLPFPRRLDAIHAWGVVAVGTAGLVAIPTIMATLHAADRHLRWWWPTDWMAAPAAVFIAGLALAGLTVLWPPGGGVAVPDGGGDGGLLDEHSAASGPGAGRMQPEPRRLVSMPPRPALLAGRESLIAELHARLSWDVRGGPRVVTLHGMGGIGKTSVAVTYAHDHQPAHVVTWHLPAEDSVVLAAAFGRLAVMLGAAGGASDPRDPVTVVHAWLAASPSPWLLIFDNAPGQEAVRAFLPPAGNGRVLITSQSPLWPHGQGLEVPVLDDESAASFLITRTGSADRQAAAELAGVLGGLPLALEQAGAYILACGVSLVGYLGQFRGRRAEMLGRGEPEGYDKTVATTWSLAFRRLEDESPAAISLLRLLACCAAEPVPLELLLQPPELPKIEPRIARDLLPLIGDPLVSQDAVAALRRYSLINSGDTGEVMVHRLVQDVTSCQMPTDLAEAWRRAAATLIQGAVPRGVASAANLPILRSLLPHAQAVFPEHSSGLAEFTNVLGRSGSYQAARDLYQRITTARMLLHGPEHHDTVTARHDLAHWTGLAGDAATARDQFAALLPVSRRVYGAQDRHTLTTRHSLAYWTGEAGDPATARDQLTALLPVRQHTHGPGDPDTLNCRHDLARWTGEAGDPATARNQLAELLPVMERNLTPGHQDIVNCRHDLARWTAQAGDPATARDQLAELLPFMEHVLGAEHPDTLNCRHDLARWTGEAGDPATARDHLAELLPVMERQLGPEHPATLAARENLADLVRSGQRTADLGASDRAGL